MTNFELAAKVTEIATKYKTLYVLGCFGWPLTEANKQRSIKEYSYNAKADRKKMINAASADTFGFDCVNLIKGVLWGWNGDKNANYGGAKYASNDVPDIGADAMINVCKDVSTDFNKIEVGEAVWMSGHIGIYIGGGLAVECSPAFENKVQITAVGNIGKKSGYNTRTWVKHGKLPYITHLPQGDIDGDGKVTSEDARLALRAAVSLESLSDAQKTVADTDGDGKVTAEDAREILRKSVELEG